MIVVWVCHLLLDNCLQYEKDGSATAMIWAAAPQPRSDRQASRVETNPEQLAAASAEAEISAPVRTPFSSRRLLGYAYAGVGLNR